MKQTRQANRINDIHDFVSDLNFLSENMTGKEIASWAIQTLKPYNIVVKYELSHDDLLRRLILSASKGPTNLRYPISRMCNGLVIALTSEDVWKVVSVPPPVLARNASIGRIRIEDYDIVEIQDGTVVTMYYYDGEWRYSSSNGYDVTNYRWMGELTFGEAIKESLLGCNDDISSLDIDSSYSFGFSHPSFHFFNQDKPTAWFIQKTNLSTLKIVTTEDGNDMNLPMPKKIPLTQGFKNAGNLIDYMKKNDSLGYILRNATREGPFMNILLESSKLKFARATVYKLKTAKSLNTNINIDHTNRLQYSLLRLFLRDGSLGDKSIYARYFPQHKKIFNEYGEIFVAFAKKVLKMCKSVGAVIHNAKCPADQLALSMSQLIVKNGTIQYYDSNAGDLIYDYVVNIKYIDIYYGVLIKPAFITNNSE